MSEKDKPFTVSDRRHFAPDGRAREEPASPAAGAASEAAAPTGAAGEGAPEAAPAPGPLTLTGFLLSLGAEAAALLSQAGERGPGASPLEAARQIISILEMLKDKTEGRRTPEEERVLDELLFQLRLAYVQRQESGTR